MSTPNLKTLQAAIAAVRADLSSDSKEDNPTSGDKQDMSDDQKLLAALDAVTKAIPSDGAEPAAPKSLKEASARAREQFAAGRAGSQSK